MISWEGLRMGEKTWAAKSWHEVKKSWEDMRWVEMRWEDTDCGDRGMQWAISKRNCDEMRSDEMRKKSTFKRHGIRSKVKSLLLRSTGGLPVTYRHWNFRPRLARALLLSTVFQLAHPVTSVAWTLRWCIWWGPQWSATNPSDNFEKSEAKELEKL